MVKKLTALQKTYEERFWRGYRHPNFTEDFKRTVHLRKEVDTEIKYLLTRKPYTVKPTGTSGKRALSNLVRDLKALNDTRNEVSLREAQRFRKEIREERAGKERKIKVTWKDLNEKQWDIIVERLDKRGGILSDADILGASDLKEGLTEEVFSDEVKQSNIVIQNLENQYDLAITKGSNVPYQSWIDEDTGADEEGALRDTGYRTKSGKDTGYTKREPLTKQAIKGLKKWREEREVLAGRGSLVYSSLLFFFLIFWVFIFLLLTRKGINFNLSSMEETSKQVRGGF